MEESIQMAWYLPILIFFARICDVSIGTVRTMLVISGHRYVSALLGFFEVMIWVLAVGGALAYLHNPLALIGYAGGFAAGILVGMWLEERIALGYRAVRVISVKRGGELADVIRNAGFRVTEVKGAGRSGPIEIAFIVVRRKALADLRRVIEGIDPDAFVTIERVDKASGGEFTESRFGKAIIERAVPVRK